MEQWVGGEKWADGGKVPALGLPTDTLGWGWGAVHSLIILPQSLSPASVPRPGPREPGSGGAGAGQGRGWC